MARDFISSFTSSPLTPRSLEGGTGEIKNTERGGFNSTGKNLIVEIPLLPQPVIQCNTLTELSNATFVNVVLENEASSGGAEGEIRTYFRVSDESNKEVCRIVDSANTKSQFKNTGIKYLECLDVHGNCIILIGYAVGLGEVALLSPKEEFIGECQSNVEFICLSVKVKYGFYDVNGSRLMKMTAIMPEAKDRGKFIIMVKRSKNEKLALIKMGSLKSCSNIRFKPDQTTTLERLQIVALWVGFMHNELKDVEAPLLLERQLTLKQQKEESQKKSTPPETNPVEEDFNGPPNVQNDAPSNDTTNRNSHISSSIKSPKFGNKGGISKIKQLKSLVSVRLSRRPQQHHETKKNINDNNNDNYKLDQHNIAATSEPNVQEASI